MIKLDKSIDNNSIKIDDSIVHKSLIKSMRTTRSIREASDACMAEEETKKNQSALSTIQYKIRKWLIKFEGKKLTKDKESSENSKKFNNSRMSIAEELKYFNPKSNNSNMIAGK